MKRNNSFFTDLAEFIQNFEKDFCEKHCEDCPYTRNCDNIFGYADTPYSTVRRVISFFEMIDDKGD